MQPGANHQQTDTHPMTGARDYSPDDDAIRERLDRISRQPVSSDPKIVRRQLDELDQLTEEMIGRRQTSEMKLQIAIQNEVLHRGPDRTIPAKKTGVMRRRV